MLFNDCVSFWGVTIDKGLSYKNKIRVWPRSGKIISRNKEGENGFAIDEAIKMHDTLTDP